MTTYRSRIGLELILPITLILGVTGTLMAVEKAWIGLVIVLLVAVFIAHMFFTTYYQVTDQHLRIRCGILYDKTIPIDSIREIKPTRNPISAPATSLDRIVIWYNKFDTVILSPDNKAAFIEHLRSIQPGIKLTTPS